MNNGAVTQIYALIRASYSDIHYQLIDNARKMKTLAALLSTFSELIHSLLLVNRRPRELKVLSASTLVTGTDKYLNVFIF